MIEKIKTRTFEILEIASTGDTHSRVFDIFIMTLISLNVIAVILETVESFASQYMPFFEAFEVFSVTIFTIEYLLRIWTCTMDKRFNRPIMGRYRFSVTPLAIVDLIAIIPFYIPMIIPLDLRFIRALRLFRFFRLLKMGRYSESFKTFGNVLKAKKEELIVTIFSVLILLIIASSLMYFCENEAQPQVFSSIPATMWWAVATLTTVGYGDIYPITPFGKIFGSIVAILGVGMFALPTGILGSGFIEDIQNKQKKSIFCPHCGKDIDGQPEKLLDEQ